jgi:hypothetical protein
MVGRLRLGGVGVLIIASTALITLAPPALVVSLAISDVPEGE